MSTQALIEACTAPLFEADRAALDDLLIDAVAQGASVGYVGVPCGDVARAYWRGVEEAVAAGTRALLAARVDGQLAGSVQLGFDTRANSKHRAEVNRLLVHSGFRRRGLGRALMLAAERAARRDGRWLLLLDVREGDPAGVLYRTLGWQVVGRVPDYVLSGSGDMEATVFMFRRLDESPTQRTLDR